MPSQHQLTQGPAHHQGRPPWLDPHILGTPREMPHRSPLCLSLSTQAALPSTLPLLSSHHRAVRSCLYLFISAQLSSVILGDSQSLLPHLSHCLISIELGSQPSPREDPGRSPKSTLQSFCGHSGENESVPTIPRMASEAGLRTRKEPAAQTHRRPQTQSSPNCRASKFSSTYIKMRV